MEGVEVNDGQELVLHIIRRVLLSVLYKELLQRLTNQNGLLSVEPLKWVCQVVDYLGRPTHQGQSTG